MPIHHTPPVLLEVYHAGRTMPQTYDEGFSRRARSSSGRYVVIFIHPIWPNKAEDQLELGVLATAITQLLAVFPEAALSLAVQGEYPY